MQVYVNQLPPINRLLSIKHTFWLKETKKNALTEIRTDGLPVFNIIYQWTGWPGKNEKFWSPQIYLATHICHSKNRLLITGVAFEKNDGVGWVMLKNLPQWGFRRHYLHWYKVYFISNYIILLLFTVNHCQWYEKFR